jgi:(p)ppGpp synthase/HD superfamily hydrolase
MPKRIKDYIALPKPNGYQSIHTTIFTGHGGVLEIQIRTEEMDNHAKYGVASHLGYKAKNDNEPQNSKNKDWITKIFSFSTEKNKKNEITDGNLNEINIKDPK